MKIWASLLIIMGTYLKTANLEKSKPSKTLDEIEEIQLVSRIVDRAISKFWYSVEHDDNVQAAIRYVNGCHFRKLVQSVERDRNFKKLKILLVKNGIIDLCYRKLVPMKYLMSKIPPARDDDMSVPDLTSLVSDIEDLLENLPAHLLHNYNARYSTISKRIQEASLGEVIGYYVDEILTLPQTNILLHEFIRLSFNVDEFIELIFAYFGVYDDYYQQEFNAIRVKPGNGTMEQEDLVPNHVTESPKENVTKPETPANDISKQTMKTSIAMDTTAEQLFTSVKGTVTTKTTEQYDITTAESNRKTQTLEQKTTVDEEEIKLKETSEVDAEGETQVSEDSGHTTRSSGEESPSEETTDMVL